MTILERIDTYLNETNDTFIVYGRQYKTKTFTSDNEVNEFLGKNKNYAIIGTEKKDGKEIIHVALKTNKGIAI